MGYQIDLESIENKVDFSNLKRHELRPAKNLKSIFNDIRNYLAGNVTGITRDETLAQQSINVLFCKIYDEYNTEENEVVTFRAGKSESDIIIHERIEKLFKKVKSAYKDVFSTEDKLLLDPKSLAYIIKKLQAYSITAASREAIGEAFELFIGHALKGAEGQFFTPKNVVDMTINILDPKIEDKLIDPACGSGGFLASALVYLSKKGKINSMHTIKGIDKDRFLVRVTSAYLALIGNGKDSIFCENSLEDPAKWDKKISEKVSLEQFDIVVTNPPFGSRIPINDKLILSKYELGHVWTKNDDERWTRTSELQSYQPPQVLFIERCLNLLKPGGINEFIFNFRV